MNDWNSHESVCVLNTSDEDAELQFTLFFEDREPCRDFKSKCPAQRAHHVRLDKIRDAAGNGIITDIPYAMLVESNVPVVVQYSRLDTSHREMTLMTTIAYPVDD